MPNPTAQELIDNPDISSFLATHQGADEFVRKAARELAGKPDAPAALKKLLPALTSKIVNVFFSYKNKDQATANAVVNVLRQASAGKLNITFQGGFLQQTLGQNWRQLIHNSIRDANWFILLLPDPSDELDWCLYETGLFAAQLTSADRLICLHHPDSVIPDPIEHFHAVQATTPELQKFFRKVFIDESPVPGLPPINDSIADQIPKFAETVRQAIRGQSHLEILVPSIELHIEDLDALKTKEDLDSATILDANKWALDIFDLLNMKNTFGELRAPIKEEKGDGRWREGLVTTIQRIVQGHKSYPIQAVFRNHSGRFFRPIFHAVKRLGRDGPIQSFQVTLTEVVSHSDTGAMPSELTTLVTLLRFAFRFRWEVLERFSKGPLNLDDVEQLDVNLRRIVIDWQYRGTVSEADIFGLFPEPKAADRLRKMTIEWRRISNPDRTGELDLAIEKKDTTRIPGLLSSILPMNQEFLEMTADRFAEMVGKK